VLVSSTVKDLVAGSGLDFRERGAALRGIPGDWHLFALAASLDGQARREPLAEVQPV
jgi:hypothetical protein